MTATAPSPRSDGDPALSAVSRRDGVARVPQEGVEPPTKRLEGSCSIH